MPTEYKHFFNQLDNHLKPLKTNHLIKLLKADPPSQIFISALPTPNISIPVAMHHHFSSWDFPQNLSQSSIQGPSRSNACTLIALTTAKLFSLHGHNLALFAHCECTSLPELLDWFRTFYAYQYTLGPITNMTFNTAR